MFQQVLSGLAIVSRGTNILACLGGTAFGIIVGILPGLNASTGVALLLPLTYGLEPLAALIMLCGIYAGAVYGGSITAILLGIPGTSTACATILDGYELAKQGRAGAAIGMAAIASCMGGQLSVIVLIVVASQLAKVALQFGPAEYFALGVFGLSVITSLESKSVGKGLIAGCAGFLLSTVGIDQFVGVPRFIFGKYELMSGIEMLPVFIGFFAGAEALRQSETVPSSSEASVIKYTDTFPTIQELRNTIPTILRSSVLGTIIGILPGAGATIAAFLGYSEGKRWSKHPEKYGTGYLEGVAAPEAANNAAVGGAMVPMLTLGIPGSGTTAIMLGALMIHGLQPGPLLFRNRPDLVFGLYGGMILANFAFLILGIFAARHFARVLGLPKAVLSVLVFTFCIVGAYSASNSLFDVWLMLGFSVAGYLMKKTGFPVTPLVLGFVLGPIVEENLRRALIVLNGRWQLFFIRPISGVLLVLAIATLIAPLVREWMPHLKKRYLKSNVT